MSERAVARATATFSRSPNPLPMRSFSERIGLKKPRTIVQLDDMDEALRTDLWNLLLLHFFQPYVATDPYGYGPREPFPVDELREACAQAWRHFFKKPLDTLPRHWRPIHDELRGFVSAAPWNEVYDFIEFFASAFPLDYVNEQFRNECNEVLEREMSAYRFVGGHLVRVTDKSEVEAIEDAFGLSGRLRAVSAQLETALQHLSARKSPDYRNSIKESISAVEGMCALITGQDRADLSAALRALEKDAQLHGALKSAFNSLYGFTNDSGGIRHALLDGRNPSHDDAKFMLVACSAFVNYLKVLALRARLI